MEKEIYQGAYQISNLVLGTNIFNFITYNIVVI